MRLRTRHEVDEQMTEAISVNESTWPSGYCDMHGRATLSARGFVFVSEEQEQILNKSLTSEQYDGIANREAHTQRKICSPVRVEDGSIKVSSKQLEIGKQYPIIFNDKRYVVIAPKKGVIDLYEFPTD